jgi:dCTP deaminase
VILTDREIKLALDLKQIIIDPVPGAEAYSSTAVDLRLDPNITEFKDDAAGLETIIDPSHREFHPERIFTQISEKHSIDAQGGYLIKPNTLILGWTKEYLKVPSDQRLAARVEGKSSLARLGLGIHITAPTIHAGFNGRIRLEMINHGKQPIRLRVDMRICQLIFEQTLGTPDKGYEGRFSGQSV